MVQKQCGSLNPPLDKEQGLRAFTNPQTLFINYSRLRRGISKNAVTSP
jgi:hypothetical protein